MMFGDLQWLFGDFCWLFGGAETQKTVANSGTLWKNNRMKMAEKMAAAMLGEVARQMAGQVRTKVVDGQPIEFTGAKATVDFDQIALAGLRAMREPTDAMVEAVSMAEDKQGYVASAYETMHCAEAWPLMIDAAIAEVS